jgi:hypothetical protein
MSHPKLLFKDYRLLVASSGQRYMADKEIVITAKLGAEPMSGNEFSYGFGLSNSVDDIWCRMLKEELPEFPWNAASSAIFITCIRSNLEGRYAKLKQAISRVNPKYLALFKKLKQQIFDEAEQREKEHQQGAENVKAVRKAFDDLQL